MEFLTRRFVRANRIPAVLPPQAPRLSAFKRRWSGSTLKTLWPVRDWMHSTSRSISRESKVLRLGLQPHLRPGFVGTPLIAQAALVLLVCVLGLSAMAGVREVSAIALTVNDLKTELSFFTNTLPFELVSISQASGKDRDELLGLNNVKLKIAMLKLGDERISLTEHLSQKGGPIPQDSRSVDRWFQHIAIVVSDMDKAYARLVEHKITHVSTAPQTLPEWNKDAGGIKAFYFRDPEDHVLEIIWFPAGKGNPKWQQPTDRIFLGIDHTAIVVSDTDKSLEFYRDQLGLKVTGGAHNYGTEQEHLNQVFGANLRITALRADRGPGIELLEYIAPPGGRALPTDSKANDLVFWTTQLVVDDMPGQKATLRASGTKFVSRPDGNPAAQIVRDPDGHALQLNQGQSNGLGAALTSTPGAQ